MHRPRCARTLLILFTTCVLGVAAACGGGSTGAGPVTPSPTPSPTPPPAPSIDRTPPSLSVTIVDLARVVAFIPFGETLSSGRQNPAFELRTDALTATVRSVSAGVVTDIQQNPAPQTDAEIHVKPAAGSVYLLVYDHVQDLAVRVGDAVAPGQTLGRVGPWDGSHGRTELQINRDDPAPTVAVCPRSLSTEAVNAAYDSLALRLRGTHTVCTADTVVP